MSRRATTAGATAALFSQQQVQAAAAAANAQLQAQSLSIAVQNSFAVLSKVLSEVEQAVSFLMRDDAKLQPLAFANQLAAIVDMAEKDLIAALQRTAHISVELLNARVGDFVSRCKDIVGIAIKANENAYSARMARFEHDVAAAVELRLNAHFLSLDEVMRSVLPTLNENPKTAEELAGVKAKLDELLAEVEANSIKGLIRKTVLGVFEEPEIKRTQKLLFLVPSDGDGGSEAAGSGGSSISNAIGASIDAAVRDATILADRHVARIRLIASNFDASASAAFISNAIDQATAQKEELTSQKDELIRQNQETLQQLEKAKADLNAAAEAAERRAKEIAARGEEAVKEEKERTSRLLAEAAERWKEESDRVRDEHTRDINALEDKAKVDLEIAKANYHQELEKLKEAMEGFKRDQEAKSKKEKDVLRSEYDSKFQQLLHDANDKVRAAEERGRAEKENATSSLEEAKTALEIRAKTAEAQVASLTTQHEALQKDLSSLRSQLELLQTAKDSAAAQDATQRVVIATLQEQLKAANADLEAQKKLFSEREEHLKQDVRAAKEEQLRAHNEVASLLGFATEGAATATAVAAAAAAGSVIGASPKEKERVQAASAFLRATLTSPNSKASPASPSGAGGSPSPQRGGNSRQRRRSSVTGLETPNSPRSRLAGVLAMAEADAGVTMSHAFSSFVPSPSASASASASRAGGSGAGATPVSSGQKSIASIIEALRAQVQTLIKEKAEAEAAAHAASSEAVLAIKSATSNRNAAEAAKATAAALASDNAAKGLLVKQLSEAQERIIVLDSQLASSQQAVSAADDQLQSMKKQLQSALESARLNKEEALNSMKTMLEDLRKEVKESYEQVLELKASKSSLQTTLMELEAEHVATTTALATLNSKLDIATATLVVVKKEKEKLEKEANRLAADVKQAKAEHSLEADSLKASVAALREQLDKEKEKAASALGDAATAMNKLSALQISFNTVSSALKAAQVEREKNQDQLLKLSLTEDALRVAEARAAAMSSSSASAESTIAEIRKRYESSVARLRTTAEELSAAQSELVELRSVVLRQKQLILSYEEKEEADKILRKHQHQRSRQSEAAESEHSSAVSILSPRSVVATFSAAERESKEQHNALLLATIDELKRELGEARAREKGLLQLTQEQAEARVRVPAAAPSTPASAPSSSPAGASSDANAVPRVVPASPVSASSLGLLTSGEIAEMINALRAERESLQQRLAAMHDEQLRRERIVLDVARRTQVKRDEAEAQVRELQQAVASSSSSSSASNSAASSPAGVPPPRGPPPTPAAAIASGQMQQLTFPIGLLTAPPGPLMQEALAALHSGALLPQTPTSGAPHHR